MLFVASIAWAVYEYNNPPVPKGEYHELGLDYYEKKDYSDAIIAFDKALEKDSLNAEVLFFRGMAEIYLGNYKKGSVDCKKACELDSEFEELYYKYDVKYFEDYGKNLKIILILLHLPISRKLKRKIWR